MNLPQKRRGIKGKNRINKNITTAAHSGTRKIVSVKKRPGFISVFLPKKNTESFEVVRYREGVDRLFLIMVIILLSIGTVMVFSSSYANGRENYGDSYFFVKKQIIMAIVGIIGMVAASYLAEYNFLRRISVVFFFATLLLNYLTPFIGKAANGAPRWFPVGPIQVQPSEFLKLAMVLMLANYITVIGDKMKTFKFGILIPFGIIGMIAGALYLQSHFSGLIILAVVAIVLIFIGEAPAGWLIGFAVVGAIGLTCVILFTDYAKARVDAWIDPFSDPTDDGFQIIQSLYAIGSGGMFGVGIGESRQKFLYLPEPQNDYIFSIICEEMGFIGALIIIALFVILIWRGFVIAFHAPDKFSSLVVIGITAKVALQTILNLGVVTNAIPSTGISLPFFSYGGTALAILLVEMGIVLSISRYSYQEKV